MKAFNASETYCLLPTSSLVHAKRLPVYSILRASSSNTTSLCKNFQTSAAVSRSRRMPFLQHRYLSVLPPTPQPQREPGRIYPIRKCCACRTSARLGDWNPVPPEMHELCYFCDHQLCEGCTDRWGTPDENMESAASFRNYQNERRKRARKRKELTPWVAEIIEHHNNSTYE
jgi:hypothetical protein